jgi:CBS domain containing-hemolysin-like protein
MNEAPERIRFLIKELEAQLAAQNPEIKGLRALQGVTYVSVSDKNGRMDDDLFEHVEAQKRIAEVHVGETMIDRIPEIDWIDQDTADWEIAVGKLKENKT